jgi:hypothetical protein
MCYIVQISEEDNVQNIAYMTVGGHDFQYTVQVDFGMGRIVAEVIGRGVSTARVYPFHKEPDMVEVMEAITIDWAHWAREFSDRGIRPDSGIHIVDAGRYMSVPPIPPMHKLPSSIPASVVDGSLPHSTIDPSYRDKLKQEQASAQEDEKVLDANGWRRPAPERFTYKSSMKGRR